MVVETVTAQAPPPPAVGIKSAVTSTLTAPPISLEPEYLPTKHHTEILPAEVRPVTEQITTTIIQPVNREVIKPVQTTLQQPIIREEHPVHTTIIQPVVTTTVRQAPSSVIVPVHSTTQVDTVHNTITNPAQAGPTVVGEALPAAPTQTVGDFSTPQKR